MNANNCPPPLVNSTVVAIEDGFSYHILRVDKYLGECQFVCNLKRISDGYETVANVYLDGTTYKAREYIPIRYPDPIDY